MVGGIEGWTVLRKPETLWIVRDTYASSASDPTDGFSEDGQFCSRRFSLDHDQLLQEFVSDVMRKCVRQGYVDFVELEIEGYHAISVEWTDGVNDIFSQLVELEKGCGVGCEFFVSHFRNTYENIVDI